MADIKKALKEFNKEQLVLMLGNLTDKNYEFKKEVLDFIQKNSRKFKEDKEKQTALSEYNSLWSEAELIISDFNELGGGDEEDEEIVYGNFSKIIELFKNGKLDEKIKNEFIDGCFEEYYYGNSGFEDLLRDSVLEICTNRDDWLKVIGKLRKSSGDYDRDCIAKIYKENLRDNENYLRERLSNLDSCADYEDLADYYYQKGDTEKAVQIAKEGIDKGKGWKRELIEFLINHYKKQSDYPNVLKYLILSFEEEPTLEKYIEIKKFCKKEDLDRVLKQLHDALKSSRADIKAEIDYFNEDYKAVFIYLKSILNSYYEICKFKEWAKKLELYFPEEILKLYREKALSLIETKNAKNYFEAAFYLAGVKRIFNSAKRKDEWEKTLSLLKKKYINLPALQRELGELE